MPIQDIQTTALHGGRRLATGDSLTAPIAQSTTFAQTDPAHPPAHTYSRASNPTVNALERRLGALEDARALAFGSGMAALTTLCLATLKAGDTVLVSKVVYGGTYRFFEQYLTRLGISVFWFDTDDTDHLPDRARLMIVETPANHTLGIVDLEYCAGIARDLGALFVVDNTFLTSVFQRPLDGGADVTLYSTTKFYDGHNATTGGALVTRDSRLNERLETARKSCGTIQQPFNAWLTLQGIKTLPTRLLAQSNSAAQIAGQLLNHPAVETVHYPFLGPDCQVAIARRQQEIGGALFSIELRGGSDAARRFCQSLRLVTLAENLGSVESLATHPATMTHGSMDPELRRSLGITDGLIRISVGLESANCILADIVSALGGVQP